MKFDFGGVLGGKGGFTLEKAKLHIGEGKKGKKLVLIHVYKV